jgi:hypothetical protein
MLLLHSAMTGLLEGTPRTMAVTVPAPAAHARRTSAGCPIGARRRLLGGRRTGATAPLTVTLLAIGALPRRMRTLLRCAAIPLTMIAILRLTAAILDALRTAATTTHARIASSARRRSATRAPLRAATGILLFLQAAGAYWMGHDMLLVLM